MLALKEKFNYICIAFFVQEKLAESGPQNRRCWNKKRSKHGPALLPEKPPVTEDPKLQLHQNTVSPVMRCVCVCVYVCVVCMCV